MLKTAYNLEALFKNKPSDCVPILHTTFYIEMGS